MLRVRYKKGLMIFFASTFLISLAIGGSFLLGKIYINILSTGPKNDQNGSTKEVTTKVDEKSNPVKTIVKLDPLPLYFVQVGVYSDAASAKKSIDDLKKTRITAYTGKTAPFRVYTGIFQQKENAQEAKKELESNNISAYISTIVLNSSNIILPEQKDTKDIDNLMKKLNEWFKLNLTINEATNFEKIDSISWKEKLTKSDEMFKGFKTSLSKVSIIQECFKPIEAYQSQATILKEAWTFENYVATRVKFMEGLSEYMNWCQKYTDKQ